MQEELKALQQRLGITFIFVTHDQGEALSMADRIAVFDAGKIMQVATPTDLYQRPQSRFVADFVGSANVLPPSLTERYCAEKAYASLRPEAIRLVSADSGNSAGNEQGVCAAVYYQGAFNRIAIDVDGFRLNVLQAAAQIVPAVGDRVSLSWDHNALHIMPDQS